MDEQALIAATKNKGGRPSFKPTDADREKALHMSALGTSQSQIATFFGIDPKTLRKHFQKELERAAIKANLQVAETLFDMATSGKHVTATIFWARTRNRFSTLESRRAENELNKQQKLDDEPKTSASRPPSTIVVLNNDHEPVSHE